MSPRAPDLVCLSHLRWNFVFQRPQHLMSRFARDRRVFFIEEPVWGSGKSRLETKRSPEGVWVCTPILGKEEAVEWSNSSVHDGQQALLSQLFVERRIRHFDLWYYTPMALLFTRHLKPRAVVYDCMDELSHFKDAPVSLVEREQELLEKADVVFTGGHSLYEAKKHRHHNIHPCPSSVDVTHFARGRLRTPDPADQAVIPHPRVGFVGVIDERMNLDLLDGIARLRPEWQVILIGPVVKISPDALPRRPNLHYLGPKAYEELPGYLAGWDVALMPFALNDATRFISPTKTPEYLAAGKPVVSTSIRDVVRPYGERSLVEIADTEAEFVAAIDRSLSMKRAGWLQEVDAFLATTSWNKTWSHMKAQLDAVSTPRHKAVVRASDAVAQ